MRKLRWFSALAMLALTACGGSAGNCSSAFTASCGTGGTPGTKVASVLLLTDTITIPSDNSAPANLTAYVSDTNNNFLSGVPVSFVPSSGHVTVTQATTDTNGKATATLNTLGDPSNRSITVTATANPVVATATVDVTGTTLQVQGSNTLTTGQTATYTVVLTDAGAKGIANTPITITAPANLTVSATTVTTDSQGRASFNATGGSGSSGALAATGLGLTASITVAVNSDALNFTAPAANTNIPLNTLTTFTVHWAQSGVGVANQPISFATTRGCINPAGTVCTGQSSTATANTNASGDATVSLLSDNAGGATVTATTAGGLTANLTIQFIATVAASIDVQPSAFVLAPNDQSTISAIVRDANNNLVTGATVVFSLNDVTGGTLTTASAKTDLEGRAQTVYTAGTVTSAASGVQITAAVQTNPAVNRTVSLTVAARQVFISIGTGNEIFEPNPAQYSIPYVIQVTDSTGAGVKGVSLGMSVLSQRYFKGFRQVATGGWATCYTIPQDAANCIIGTPPSATVTMGCADEDFNRNGVLDPGENKNGNNPATVSAAFPTGYPTLEAGNIATVAATTSGSLVTDDSGFAFATVYYPQEYAYYLQVTLQAQASVQGTAFFASSTFLLPGSASDFNSPTKAPPGIVSPFGQSNVCTDML
jgi:hypothetical protein